MIDFIPDDQLTRQFQSLVKEIDTKIEGNYITQIKDILERISNKKRPLFKTEQYKIIEEVLVKELNSWQYHLSN